MAIPKEDYASIEPDPELAASRARSLGMLAAEPVAPPDNPITEYARKLLAPLTSPPPVTHAAPSPTPTPPADIWELANNMGNAAPMRFRPDASLDPSQVERAQPIPHSTPSPGPRIDWFPQPTPLPQHDLPSGPHAGYSPYRPEELGGGFDLGAALRGLVQGPLNEEQQRNLRETAENIPVLGGILNMARQQVEQGAFGGPNYAVREALAAGDEDLASNIAINTVAGAVAPIKGVGKALPPKGAVSPAEAVRLAKEAQGPVRIEGYRGVGTGRSATGTADTIGGARFFSPDKAVARSYARGGEVVKETLTFENPVVADNWMALKTQFGMPLSATMDDLVVAAKSQGHDGIVFRNHNGQPEFVDLSSVKLPKPAVENLGVNLEKLDTPNPTKDYIEQVARQNAGFEAQRRGVVSVEETLNAATKQKEVAETYAYLKPGTALNAEEIVTLKGGMIAKGEEVTALQNQVRDAAKLRVKSEELNLRLMLASLEHKDLQRSFAGVRSESGRALRIQREITGALREASGTAYDRAIAAIGGRERANALIDRLQKIWTDPNLDDLARQRATFKFIQNLDDPKFFERMDSYWLNAILGNIPTQFANVVGQVGLGVMEVSSKFVAAGIEAGITVGGKTRPREVFFSEAASGLFGGIMGLGPGFRRAAMMLRTGVTPEMMTKFHEYGTTGGREVNPGIFNISTRTIGAVDQVFYGWGYSRGLYERAANIAAREKKGLLSGDFGRRVAELVTNPTEEMLTHADLIGRRAGLRSEPGKVAQGILQLRDVNFLPEVITAKTGEFRPIRYVVPFVNTPIQIVKIGGEYAFPLGLVRLVTAKAADRSDIIARQLLGGIGMGVVVSKYASGEITGAAPRDPAERDAFYAAGKLPYAMKIGDNWVSFARLEPVTTPLKWTALLLDALKEDPDWDIGAVAGKIGGVVAKALKDGTYLSGFSALMDVFDEDNPSVEKLLGRIATGFIPGQVRTSTQASDPFIRQPNGIIEQIEAVLPGLNQNVPVRQTAYGEPAERSEGKQGIYGAISPVDINTERTDPVADRLSQYQLPELIGPDGKTIPASNIQVGFVSKEIASYRLSREEGIRYQQYAGNATHNLLSDLFNDLRPYDGQAFSTLDETNQIRAIRKAIDDARVVGRTQVADEILHSATDTPTISRAVDMRLSTLTKNRDRATFLEGLQAQGKLAPEVRAFVDAHKAKDEPTVSEYLRAAPLVREYLAEPPYIIGNPAEWARLDAAREHLARETRALGYTSTSDEIRYDAMARLSESEQNLIFTYQSPKLRNKARTIMLQQYPFLSRFLSDTSTLQVP